MQNAWRFVEDEALRERLKEAKGIGTPATRAEIISGLKKQGFLTAQGKNIVPTDRGLALFGLLKRADPALVDPGVTAELERLLDDVLTGRQKMTGAVDAVCDSARRIIGRLQSRNVDDGALVTGGAAGLEEERPPTASMRRFAASIARRKGIRPPAGYTRSAKVCRKFLDEHAPRRTEGESMETAAGGGPDVPTEDVNSRWGGRTRSGKVGKRKAANSQRTPDTKQSGRDRRRRHGRLRKRRLPFEFRTETRRRHSAWARATARRAGTLRLARTSQGLESADGCNASRRPRPSA